MAALIAAVYFIDRATKYAVTLMMGQGESFPVVDGVFHITLVYNTGGAFGIMKDHPYVFTAAAFVFTVSAAIYMAVRWASMAVKERTAVCLIVGGTIGNLSDRIKLGYVVDFFDLRVWPVFNVADSCITIGAAILIFSLLFPTRKNEKLCTE